MFGSPRPPSRGTPSPP
ncbi:hypothetical protein ZEAMMB73_Zm00001d019578 [Zea mays]|uniref:Uncharacterized protein n=1 Tax=Zea mays TaxID=4577 RepID=A0A1D6HYT9_MAIZE|nr:hypothetical protein ZEAMMB73_Zm00001d019578 [Zea mays]